MMHGGPEGAFSRCCAVFGSQSDGGGGALRALERGGAVFNRACAAPLLLRDGARARGRVPGRRGPGPGPRRRRAAPGGPRAHDDPVPGAARARGRAERDGATHRRGRAREGVLRLQLARAPVAPGPRALGEPRGRRPALDERVVAALRAGPLRRRAPRGFGRGRRRRRALRALEPAAPGLRGGLLPASRGRDDFRELLAGKTKKHRYRRTW